MAVRRPVMDWAGDFDHLDRAWVDDPYPIWDRLRVQCPVAHTDRYGVSSCRRATRTCVPLPSITTISRLVR